MKDQIFSIIEIGSTNTKIHVYKNKDVIFKNQVTIEFKKNYSAAKQIDPNDMEKLYEQIEKALHYTKRVYIFGCSIFRILSTRELEEVNQNLFDKFNLRLKVVSQEEEAQLTAYGCYHDIEYSGNICIFIGGGGSTELLVIHNQKIIDRKYLDFGVVDITKQFETLKDDVPQCSFDQVYDYISSQISDFKVMCDVLILAGGDHLYWYHNAGYDLKLNHLYHNQKQEYMLSIEDSDRYDRDALITSLDVIRSRSDNPLWFDGSRAMKVLTNVISHKLDAKYIIPTRINMEDGLYEKIAKGEID